MGIKKNVVKVYKYQKLDVKVSENVIYDKPHCGARCNTRCFKRL